MDRYKSVIPINQLRRQLRVKFYSTWYLHWVRNQFVSQEGQTDFEFGYKTKVNFRYVAHFSFGPNLI